ncbi:hypothetical protein F2Q69_00036339 [Brassica cretica]|uniref:Uncharacterized protein n=1 Tax=Brassica cretica TaxID=69181 RepID=A0A8S9SR01_BRACR|nr:hypothetical protein F2Q69_00036339 [Brassica cretica]
MDPLTSSNVLCGSREVNEGKLFELTGEQYKPFSGPGKSSKVSRAGEATAYTTAPVPCLASGKANTLLARKCFSLATARRSYHAIKDFDISSIQTNESFFWYLCAPRPETDPQHSAHSLCARGGVPPASLKKLGSSVKFMRPRRSGAAATLFFLSWISLVPPKRSWPYHSVPDGQRGIRYSSSRSFAPFRRTGHMLAVGSMVPKVTSVRQFRLNSSLYVSGPMAAPSLIFWINGVLSDLRSLGAKGEQYKPFSGPGKSSKAGEATAYTTAPVPRLASGKASNLLARNSSIQTNESFFWYLCTPRPETDPQHSAHSLCAREGVPRASPKKLGSSVKFMRPRRSGAAATIFFLSWISLVPPKRTGHMLAVGSMVPKVTSVRQFRLNSSLYVSGPMARAGAPRSFFLCGTMPGGEGNASRRRTTTRQLHFGFSLHEMSPVHWPMDKRTELAQKALGRYTYDVDSIRYISISF